MSFERKDLLAWRLSLSGEGRTFEISRDDLEGLLDRMEAAEKYISALEQIGFPEMGRQDDLFTVQDQEREWLKSKGEEPND